MKQQPVEISLTKLTLGLKKNPCDALICAGENDEIVFLDSDARAVFGYQLEEVTGVSLNSLLELGEQSQEDDEQSALQRHVEVIGYRKDMSIFFSPATISRIFCNGERFTVAVVHDESKKTTATQ